jgi:hypothetical protein
MNFPILGFDREEILKRLGNTSSKIFKISLNKLLAEGGYSLEEMYNNYTGEYYFRLYLEN